MDLYKWAYQLGPLAPGDLLLDRFELARDVRELDMRAPPNAPSPIALLPCANGSSTLARLFWEVTQQTGSPPKSALALASSWTGGR